MPHALEQNSPSNHNNPGGLGRGVGIWSPILPNLCHSMTSTEFCNIPNMMGTTQIDANQ